MKPNTVTLLPEIGLRCSSYLCDSSKAIFTLCCTRY